MVKSKNVIKDLELYESLFVFKFTTEDDLFDRVNFYCDFLKDRGVKPIHIYKMEKRFLAYPIQGYDIGTFLHIVYTGNDTIIKQINTAIKRDELILRGLTTKLVDKCAAKLFAGHDSPYEYTYR